MQATLLGIRALDFKSKDGDQIKGTQLFVSFPEAETDGLMAEKLFIRADSKTQLPDKLRPGDVLDVSVNLKGKVEAVKRLDGKNLPKLDS